MVTTIHLGGIDSDCAKCREVATPDETNTTEDQIKLNLEISESA